MVVEGKEPYDERKQGKGVTINVEILHIHAHTHAHTHIHTHRTHTSICSEGLLAVVSTTKHRHRLRLSSTL